MAFTQSDLENIRKAIASGVLTVRMNGRQVTYASMEELLKAKRMIESELAAGSSRLKPRYSVAVFADGS